MSKITINVILIAFFSLSILGCETELDQSSIEFKNKLVMNVLATDKEPLAVHIGKTLSLIDTTGEQIIETAKVVVTDDLGLSETLIYSFVEAKYKSSFIPIPGKKYSIRATFGNLPEAFSTLTMPKGFNSTPATWQNNTGQDSAGFAIGTIKFNITDPSDERNYYEIGLFRFEDFGLEWLPIPISPENPELATDPIINKEGAMFLDDASFNGQNKELRFSTPFGSAGTKYKYLVTIKSLSSDYYKYFKSLENYQVQGGPFSEPSAVYNNVQGGVGICAGSSIFKDTIN
jgi:hypothetical protein